MKILSNKKYDRLIVEIETLKEIRENDNWCIDMLTDRVNKLEEENKKLKEKIERWEKCFKKWWFNPQDVEYLMEEDTLQELKDIWEI